MTPFWIVILVGCPAATILLLTLRLAGNRIPWWVIAAPVAVPAVIYVICCVLFLVIFGNNVQ